MTKDCALPVLNRIALSLLMVAGAVHTGYGQAPVADFSLPAAACRGEFLEITNNSTNATSWEWDFCLHDAENLTANVSLATIQGLSGGFGYKLVEENGTWTGFVTSVNNHSIYRLEFGNSPSNTPTVTNLGNPGGLMVYPEGIEIVSDNGNWYGFVGSFNTNHGVIRLDFGTSLNNNSPAASNIGNFGFSTRFRSLKVVEQNSDLILVLAGYNLNSIIRVNFRGSFDNAISAADIFDSGTLTGLGNPMGMDMTVAPNGDIIMLVASYNGNSVSRLNFGSDVLSNPSVEATYSFPEIVKPYYVRIIREGNQYYAAVSNELLGIAILNFFELNPLETPEVVSHPTLPVGGGIATFRANGKSFVHVAGTGNNQLRQLTFESACDASIAFFSGEEAPLPSYATAGAKIVELKVFNAAGDGSTTTQQVVISSNVSPDIHFTSAHMCAGYSVDFLSQNLSGDIDSYQWSFGDTGQSSIADPVHQYNLPGAYEVVLRVTSTNGCVNIASANIVIYEKPVPDFLIPSAPVCTNNEYAFVNTTTDQYEGNLSYQWFVDGNPAGIERELVTTFNTTGPKEIKLVTSIPGCSEEITKTTSSVEAGPVVDFTWSGTCDDDTFSFQSETSDPVESFFWDFGNGQTSDEANPSEVFDEFGDFTVSLTAINSAGCNNVKSQIVEVHARPEVNFLVESADGACSGAVTTFVNQSTNPDGREITEWLWDFGDTGDPQSHSDQDGQHVFVESGIYVISLTAVTASGCVATGEKTITVQPSPAMDFSHTPACKGVPVLFKGPDDSTITDWYWEIGTSYYTAESPTHTFKSPGDYPLLLEVTASNGCASTVTRTIHVPVALTPDFSYLKNCAGQEAVFTDITDGEDPVTSRQWFINNVAAADVSPLVYTFPEAGSQNVTLKVKTLAGCTYETIRDVAIVPPPIAGFTTNPLSGAYPLEVSFTNISTLATEYSWAFSDGSASTESSPVHVFDGPGVFNVTLTAYNQQQCQDTFESVITAVAPLPDVDIERITLIPNDDGSLKLIVTINNKGNTVLKNLPIDLDFSGALVLREVMEGTIQPATRFNFVFNTGILNMEDLRYLCASISLQNDGHPAGNRMCHEFADKLLTFPAWPNPAATTLNVEWISVTGRNVRISLADACGRTVSAHEMTVASDFNRQSIDLTGLENGIYLLIIEDGGARNVQRITVSNKP